MAALGADAARLAAQIDWSGAEQHDFAGNPLDDPRVQAAIRAQFGADADPVHARFTLDKQTGKVSLTFSTLSGRELAPEELVVLQLARAVLYGTLDQGGPAALDCGPALFAAARQVIGKLIVQCAADPAWAEAVARKAAELRGDPVERLCADVRRSFGARLAPIPGTRTADEAA